MEYVVLRDVYYKYPGSVDWVLRNINLTIGEGRILVAGGTSSGKTTLLRVITGLAPQVYGGTLRGSVSRRGKIGYIPQDFDAFILMPKVIDELVYVLENIGLRGEEINKEVERISSLTGIKHLLGRSIGELSMGEKQRVAIASVLAFKPEVLILDEPFAYLDPPTARRIIRELGSTGVKSIIIAEHRLEQILDYVDRVIAISSGAIVFDGKPESLSGKHIPGVFLPEYLRCGYSSVEELVKHV